MANIARNFETMEDILRDVSYQMSLTYMPIATPGSHEDPAYRMVMTAIFQTIALIGDYWTGPHGPQVRGIQLDDVREDPAS